MFVMWSHACQRENQVPWSPKQVALPKDLYPHPDIAAESDEWIQSFKASPTQEEMNAFKCCNFGMLYISIRVAAMNNLTWLSDSPIVSLFSLPEERLVPESASWTTL